MSITIDNIARDEWDRFVLSRDEANFLHSWQWGELHESLGYAVERKGAYDDGVLIGVFLAIVKDARRGRYAEVPGGPLIDWKNTKAVKAVTESLILIGRSHRCVFVRVRPQLLNDDTSRHTLSSAGYRKAPMYLHAEHTSMLDVTQDDETLLAGMRKQTRYEVRRADKQGIVVSCTSDNAAMKEFSAVQAETARRQGFIPRPESFLQAEVSAFGDMARIYRAEKDGVLLCLALVIFYGKEAIYHEAASTLEGRNQPGAYAVQWQAIRDAREGGLSRYNFWGIADSDDPKHRHAGVTTFKRGFGGEDVTFIPAHDLVVERLGYVKNLAIETIRKKVRKL